MTGEELKKKIIDSGISMSEIAEKIGLSKQVFSQRLKSKTIKIEFYRSVLAVISGSEILNPDVVKKPSSDEVVLSREVFDQISRLTETVLSQQRVIEAMHAEKKGNMKSEGTLLTDGALSSKLVD